MKVKKMLRAKKRARKKRRSVMRSLSSILAVALLVVLCAGLLAMPRVSDQVQESEVYAASETELTHTGPAEGQKEYRLPTGMAGVAYGLECSMPGVTVNRIGTSCEQVIVGQRARRTSSGVQEWNISASLENKVDELNSAAYSMSAVPKIMSDTDYETLLQIVEAESGGEDLKGKILVANVVMNRVKHEEFPNTVTEVVWERNNGVAQFSPTYDGRISEVVVSDETREAVKQALEGVDYSQGALFFIQKSAAEKTGINWFEKDLKKLFKHGVHEFYTYPDEGEKTEEGPAAADEGQLVQMVKK